MKSGYELAVTQDSLLARLGSGEGISTGSLLELRNNQWIATAKRFSPGNLVLRQWGLIDLYSGTPDHAAKILEMTELLTYGPSEEEERLWAEGYSYWIYTRAVLAPWAEVFATEDAAGRVRVIMDAVDRCFAVTAYYRNGVLHPAPFGDLRDEPLGEPAAGLRDAMARPDPGSCAFVKVEPVAGGYKYAIRTNPVGLNTHVPLDSASMEVLGGTPVGFRFYEGYDRKYSSAREEWADMLHPERIRSIYRLNFPKRFGGDSL